MSDKNYLDKRVHEVIHITPMYASGMTAEPGHRYIGIEQEVEFHEECGVSSVPYWTIVGEDSIEIGCELIYTSPRPVSFEEPFDTFKEFVKEYQPKGSFRTSTHIHVNALDLTTRQALNVLAAWYLVEEVVVRTQHRDRFGNPFCLMLSQSDQPVSKILNKGLYSLNHSEKYFALNAASVPARGSFEFRFLPLILDTDLLKWWANTLAGIIDNTKDLSIQELLATFYDSNYTETLQRILGESHKTIQTLFESNPFNAGTTVVRAMEENLDHIHSLYKYVMNPRNFDEFIQDDLIEDYLEAESEDFEEFDSGTMHTIVIDSLSDPFSTQQ